MMGRASALIHWFSYLKDALPMVATPEIMLKKRALLTILKQYRRPHALEASGLNAAYKKPCSVLMSKTHLSK